MNSTDAITVKISTRGDLDFSGTVRNYNGLLTELTKIVNTIDRGVEITATAKYRRKWQPEETRTLIQTGTSAKAVARTLLNTLPRKGRRLFDIEIDIVKF